MAHYVVWFVAAFALLIAELLSGTFYLLMVALGFAAGGIAAAFGAGGPLQLAIGAAIGVAATMVLRRTRWGVRRQRGDAARNPDVILDIGQIVHVNEWHDGTAHVQYRGCRWDATLEPGASAAAGAQVIKAIQGSTLVLAPLPATR